MKVKNTRAKHNAEENPRRKKGRTRVEQIAHKNKDFVTFRCRFVYEQGRENATVSERKWACARTGKVEYNIKHKRLRLRRRGKGDMGHTQTLFWHAPWEILHKQVSVVVLSYVCLDDDDDERRWLASTVKFWQMSSVKTQTQTSSPEEGKGIPACVARTWGKMCVWRERTK